MDLSTESGISKVVRLALLAAAATAALSACASGSPRMRESVGLEPRPAAFNQGRISVVVVDEMGVVLPGMRVDLSWQEPSFYTTSAFTNRQGEVSFSGVPEVAEVAVDHPGGRFVAAIVVPTSGRPEFRVMLDTRGGGERRVRWSGSG